MDDRAEWTLAICGMLTLLVRAGLAMFLIGSARSKNTAAAAYRALGEICLGTLAFMFLGNLIIGGSSKFPLSAVFQPTSEDFFLITAMLIPSAIPSGATMGRSRAVVWIISSILMPGIIVPLCFRLQATLWLQKMGIADSAGTVEMCMSCGLAALTISRLVGPRTGKYNRDGSTNMIPGHSASIASAGLLIVIATWPGLVLGMGDQSFAHVGKSLFNIMLGIAFAGVITMLYTFLRFRRRDLFQLQSAILCGLIAVSGVCGFATPLECLFIGAIAGLAGPYVQSWVDIVWKVDDPGGLASVFAAGGLIGCVSDLLLSIGEKSQEIQSFGARFTGILITAVLSVGITFGVFSVVRAIIPLRSREADESDGLDLSEHDINAYPDFQQTLIKSHHLREM